MSTPDVVSPKERRTRAGVILALVVGAVGTYKAIESMTSPALPILQEEFHATPAEIAWVITGILLTGPVVTPVIGRLGDIYDKRKVLLSVLVVVGVGLLVSALSVSMPMLIAGQLLQGCGLGTVPLAVGIMQATQPEGRLRFSNGLMIGVIYFTTGVAMLASGIIIDHLDYSFLFWFPFIILAGLIVATSFLVPSCASVDPNGKVDLIGAALFGGALATFLISLTYAPQWGWTSTGFFGLLALAVLIFAVFVVVELKLRNPLIDVRILFSRHVLIACWLMIVGGFTMNAIFVAVPMQIQQPVATGYGLGVSGTMTGVVLVIGVVAGVFSPVASWVETRLGTRTASITGAVILALAFAVLMVSAQSFPAMMTAVLLVGFGSGFVITQAMNIIVATVPEDRVGAFSGMNFVVKALGSTSGAQIAGSVLATDATSTSDSPAWSAFGLIFWIGFGVAASAAILGLTVSRRSGSGPADATSDHDSEADRERPNVST